MSKLDYGLIKLWDPIGRSTTLLFSGVLQAVPFVRRILKGLMSVLWRLCLWTQCCHVVYHGCRAKPKPSFSVCISGVLHDQCGCFAADESKWQIYKFAEKTVGLHAPISTIEGGGQGVTVRNASGGDRLKGRKTGVSKDIISRRRTKRRTLVNAPQFACRAWIKRLLRKIKHTFTKRFIAFVVHSARTAGFCTRFVWKQAIK